MTAKHATKRRQSYATRQSDLRKRPPVADPMCPDRLQHHLGTVCQSCGGLG